jgi:putative oxidoreductase
MRSREDRAVDIVFLVGRIVFGGFFLFNGFSHFTRLAMMAPYTAAKGVPVPRAMVVLTGIMLLAGGASMVLGVLPVLGSWILVVFLVVVAVVMHDFWDETDPVAQQTEMVQFAKNLALAGAALMLSTVADWPLSLWPDRWPLR